MIRNKVDNTLSKHAKQNSLKSIQNSFSLPVCVEFMRALHTTKV